MERWAGVKGATSAPQAGRLGTTPRTPQFPIGAILILLCGFLVDLITPRGFADWAFYILPVLITMRTASRRTRPGAVET